MSTSNKRIPGSKSRSLSLRLKNVENRNITYVSEDTPIFWESAQGSWVTDVDGNKYLDLTSAFGVADLGHSSSVVRRAIDQQSKKMWHGMGDVYPSRVKTELLEMLAQVTPGKLSVSILSSSGAEAVESALKTARLATGRPGVITFQGAYHGLSYGTLGFTDRMEFTAPFRDQVAQVAVHLPYPDSLRGPTEEQALRTLDTFLAKGGKSPVGEIGAILFEPIQGRGGVRTTTALFLQGLRTMARKYKLLLIADEIYTGLGRTGRFFAVEHAGVTPDLLCVGKALGGGFPISACIGTAEVMSAWPTSDGEAIHTSTFLGNPLGCAMALAVLKEIKSKNLSTRAASFGKLWKEELQRELGDHPRVAQIRGMGLMLGIEVVKDKKSLSADPSWAAQMITSCLKRGLIVLAGGASRNVLTLTPPLTISAGELKRATRLLKDAFYGTDSASH